jgi:hypothetical protein
MSFELQDITIQRATEKAMLLVHLSISIRSRNIKHRPEYWLRDNYNSVDSIYDLSIRSHDSSLSNHASLGAVIASKPSSVTSRKLLSENEYYKSVASGTEQ